MIWESAVDIAKQVRVWTFLAVLGHYSNELLSNLKRGLPTALEDLALPRKQMNTMIPKLNPPKLHLFLLILPYIATCGSLHGLGIRRNFGLYF